MRAGPVREFQRVAFRTTAKDCDTSRFSLAQVGEFGFIIASLGISLNVMDKYLYPVIVAVSVITTFISLYDKTVGSRLLFWRQALATIPERLPDALFFWNNDHKTSRPWHKLIRSMLVSVTPYLVVCLFFIALFFSYAYSLVMGRIPG